MNTDDYEQIMLSKDFIDNVEFLKEGENIEVLFHADPEEESKLILASV